MSQSWYLQTADRTTVHRSCFLYIYQLIFGKDVGTNPQIGYATVLSLVAALIIGIVTAVYMYFARKLMRWYKEVLQMKMRKKNDTAVYSTGTKVIRFLVVLLMSFVAFLTLYPIFYVVLGAFKKNQELLTGGINIFPSEWIVQNFIDAWNSANFAVYTGNSIFLL